ncbi:alkaline shock response membrane anchor protein AmaP [Rhodococcus sp. NPDC058521]|uniref:alkaline shock response membrane anchor protein AmaP n=1 Tax=Rhodococcus sp. NPDC058521 TaxID=3346536 RepID=UPI00365F613C
MSRSAAFFDRLLALLIGLVLVAVGAGALIWNTSLFSNKPETITAPWLVNATESPWWGWAAGIGGVVLILLALRWLFAHSPASKAKSLQLAGSGSEGALVADIGSVADGAARALEASPGVHSAKAKSIVDRGTRTVDLSVTLDTAADLRRVTERIDEVCADFAQMLGTDSVATRTTIHFDKARHDAGSRVV